MTITYDIAVMQLVTHSPGDVSVLYIQVNTLFDGVTGLSSAKAIEHRTGKIWEPIDSFA